MDETEDYRRLVREVAATCPPLTQDQKAEIRSLILQSRRQRTPPEGDQLILGE